MFFNLNPSIAFFRHKPQAWSPFWTVAPWYCLTLAASGWPAFSAKCLSHLQAYAMTLHIKTHPLMATLSKRTPHAAAQQLLAHLAGTTAFFPLWRDSTPAISFMYGRPLICPGCPNHYRRLPIRLFLHLTSPPPPPHQQTQSFLFPLIVPASSPCFI